MKHGEHTMVFRRLEDLFEKAKKALQQSEVNHKSVRNNYMYIQTK